MAQDTLEGLCLLAGLGMPWAPPRGAGGGVWGEGRLGVSAESAAPATRFRIKRKTTSTSPLHGHPADQSCLTGGRRSKERVKATWCWKT
ncbi:hypothetical protein AMECASPLE_021440 [Ameca splendens]|uniref:Secreted protein n=1 Tax=Ameca splendens TaxID=208324 RepID=A0ABV0Z1J8_9TELE